MPMHAIAGQTVIVTGATSGIGRETALAFARQGANVVIAARRTERLEALAAEIDALGVEALAVPTDVAKRRQVKALIAKAKKRFGRIDTLVNNAGVGMVGPFAETGMKDFQRLMDVNFWGTVYACRAVLPVMAPQGGGVIINVSSILGKRAMPFSAAYSASKFAMRGFSEALRGEVAANGIEVSVVLPGAVQSEFWDEMARPDGFEMPAGVPMLPAAAVAAVILENARMPQPEVVVGFDAAMLSWFDAVAPLAVDAMMNMAAPFLQRAQGSGQAGS